jgi:predicted nucleic acid-binding Zn ribbon protein
MEIMRKSTEKPLKAAIEEFLDSYHLRDKLNEAKVIAAWENVVGEMVAKNTGRLQIRNKVLFIKVDSSALRNELMFARNKIIAALNKEVGGTVITEIVLT